MSNPLEDKEPEMKKCVLSMHQLTMWSDKQPDLNHNFYVQYRKCVLCGQIWERRVCD